MAPVKQFSPMALVKLAVSAALIGWCLRSVDPGELAAAFATIDPRAALACLAFLVAPGLPALGGLVLAFAAAVPLAAWIGVHAEASRLWRMVRSPAILATSLGIHAMTLAAVAVLCMGLKPGAPLWWQMALLTPAAMLAAAVPVSVGGWGVREAALVALAAAFAIPQSDALAVSIAFGVMMLANGVIGALLLAADPGSSRRGAGPEAPRV